jgi:hypothetical protein
MAGRKLLRHSLLGHVAKLDRDRAPTRLFRQAARKNEKCFPFNETETRVEGDDHRMPRTALEIR